MIRHECADKLNDENFHMRTVMAVAATSAILTFAAAAFAQQRSQFGTAAEAKAMLLKVVDALNSDKNKALEMINKGEGGFQDRDLYPFCFNADDGKAVAAASPNSKQALGRDVRTLKDAAGKAWKPIGGGEIDFVGQFQALKKMKYAGTLSLETHYKNAQHDPYSSSVESMDGLMQVLKKV